MILIKYFPSIEKVASYVNSYWISNHDLEPIQIFFISLSQDFEYN